MSAHKITPSNPRISWLLGEVSAGNIKIPNFQREYVWEDEQIMSLLDSIYKGYPVGSLLLWSTKVKLNHERNVGGFLLPKTMIEYPVNYVLDGQQRLTTLYGVFNSDSETGDPELASRFNVAFVPSKKVFIHASAADPKTSINLREILDTTKLLKSLTKFSTLHQEVVGDLVEKFKDYEFPVVTIRDRTNQEVCRIFQRINSSGTSLSTLELLAAWTWSDQFDLRTEIGTLIDKLSDHGYDGVDETLVMRCLASIVTHGIEPDALVDVDPAELIAAMLKMSKAVSAAIDFLARELKVLNFIYVPFPIMLVPLVKFFSLKSKPTAEQRASLKKWFWHCAFTQRYKAGTNAFVMEDISLMVRLSKGEQVFSKLDSKVDSSLFRKTWRINSTAAKATICLLAQYSPLSFLSASPVDLGRVMSAYNAREFHHIYPKAYLATKGVTFHEANVIANVCMLSSADNGSISDKDPADYITRIPKTKRKAIFKSALLPDLTFDGAAEYADFIESRADFLATAASRQISGKV